MSPSHSRHCAPAPALSDDVIVSVFLRIPPDDPASLVRASVVCKDWRRILGGPEFCRLYREFHRTPPMLGFIVNFWSRKRDDVSRFIPTTAFRVPGIGSYPSNWKAVDSRNGLILVVPEVGLGGILSTGYIVWDPITNGRWGVPFPGMDHQSWTGAVLCAKEHCDHLGCHGPPFFVAMVGSCLGTTSACVYSSESGLCSDIITLKHEDYIDSTGRSILVGNNTLCFPFNHSSRVLQYKLGEQKLSVIDLPSADWSERLVFISAEDGVLVFAGLRGTRLSLWSTEAGPDGALPWVQSRVIELQKLLPPRAFERNPSPYGREPNVSGFAGGVVFLSTMAGLYTVELNSGRTKKVAKVKMAGNVTPWLSFYTQDQARRMMPQP